MRYRAALIGNPNCGKTTLFNALTGQEQRVGNWPGVTVEKREALFWLEGDEVSLVDLPGVYSLSPDSLEERLAARYLQEERPDVVVNVLDACAPARGLYLTGQLLESGHRVVLAVNMQDEMQRRGGRLDIEVLERELGVCAAAVSARQKQGFGALFAAIDETVHKPKQSGVRTAVQMENAEKSYARVRDLLAKARYDPGRERGFRADGLLMQGAQAGACFALMLLIMLVLTFGALGQSMGAAAQECLHLFVRRPAQWFLQALGSPQWVRSLVLEGVVGSVGAVLSFVPQMLLIVLFLCIWEESGYMARAAFLADPLMRRIGLSGRSFIPLLTGLGCTAAAAAGARAVEREDERRRTILLAPLMSCGAKMPVYAWFTARLFSRGGALIVLGLYCLGIVMLLPVGRLLRGRSEPVGFALEIPPMRMPSWHGVCKRVRERLGEFVRRAGTLIFLIGVALWLLENMPLPGNRNVLRLLSGGIAPLLGPVGLGKWEYAAALTSGLAAKEAVVAALESFGVQGVLDRAQALSFMTFVALSPACLSAQAVMRRECSDGGAVARMALLQTALAWLCALAAYRVGRWIC